MKSYFWLLYFCRSLYDIRRIDCNFETFITNWYKPFKRLDTVCIAWTAFFIQNESVFKAPYCRQLGTVEINDQETQIHDTDIFFKIYNELEDEVDTNV